MTFRGSGELSADSAIHRQPELSIGAIILNNTISYGDALAMSGRP